MSQGGSEGDEPLGPEVEGDFEFSPEAEIILGITAAAEVKAILDDPSLSPDEKRARLDESRDRLTRGLQLPRSQVVRLRGEAQALADEFGGFGLALNLPQLLRKNAQVTEQLGTIRRFQIRIDAIGKGLGKLP